MHSIKDFYFNLLAKQHKTFRSIGKIVDPVTYRDYDWLTTVSFKPFDQYGGPGENRTLKKRMQTARFSIRTTSPLNLFYDLSVLYQHCQVLVTRSGIRTHNASVVCSNVQVTDSAPEIHRL